MSFVVMLIVPLALPVLSLVYAISIQIFNASWHECSWAHMVTPISIRVAIFASSLGILLPLISSSENDIIYDDIAVPLATGVGIISGLFSMIMIYRVRNIYISGPQPECLTADTTSSTTTTKANRVGEGKIIMITGANAGIGRETTRQLVSIGATVIMACRSESRANEAIDDIVNSLIATLKTSRGNNNNDDVASLETTQLLRSKEKDLRDRLIFLQMDVSDPTSIHKAVKTFLDMNKPLHILINNAGIMMGHRKTTKVVVPTPLNKNKGGAEGVEEEWEMNIAANHLGHFLLTNLLLPTLQKEQKDDKHSHDPRVIVLTSSTYHLAKAIDLDDLHCEQKSYGMFSQYAQSKLANILMAMELGKRESERVEKARQNTTKEVMVCCVHPGLVRTDVVKNMQWFMRFSNELFGFILKLLQKTPEEGAWTTVFCAMDKSLRENYAAMGVQYFMNSKSVSTGKYARDMEAAKSLWKISCDLTHIKDE